MKQKILLTGAAGFTGLFFKSAAEAAGHQVLGLQADLTGADQSVALTVQHALDVHGEDAFAFTERRARDSQRLARIS